MYMNAVCVLASWTPCVPCFIACLRILLFTPVRTDCVALKGLHCPKLMGTSVIFRLHTCHWGHTLWFICVNISVGSILRMEGRMYTCNINAMPPPPETPWPPQVAWVPSLLPCPMGKTVLAFDFGRRLSTVSLFKSVVFSVNCWFIFFACLSWDIDLFYIDITFFFNNKKVSPLGKSGKCFSSLSTACFHFFFFGYVGTRCVGEGRLT